MSERRARAQARDAAATREAHAARRTFLEELFVGTFPATDRLVAESMEQCPDRYVFRYPDGTSVEVHTFEVAALRRWTDEAPERAAVRLARAYRRRRLVDGEQIR